MSALSVSTSAMISPFVTRSPSFLSQRTIFPSCMSAPSFGITTSVATLSTRPAPQEPLRPGDDPLHVRDGQFLEVLGVGERDLLHGDPHHRGIQVVEGLLLDPGGHLGPHAEGVPVLLYHQGAV